MRTYADLIEHLIRKNELLQAIEMDFEGKNILLYYPGVSRSMTLSATGSSTAFAEQMQRNPSTAVYKMTRGPATKEIWTAISNGFTRKEVLEDPEEQSNDTVSAVTMSPEDVLLASQRQRRIESIESCRHKSNNKQSKQ